MVILLRPQPDPSELDELMQRLSDLHLSVHTVSGGRHTLLVLVGDTSAVDADRIRALSAVQEVRRVDVPYPRASRAFHPEDTIISVGGVLFGGGNFPLIAGPCSVESEAQICRIAESVKSSGAALLRGGAFKPRTSPYSFQGLREEGIRLLSEAKRRVGLPVVTEIMESSQLPLFTDVDVIQVGARNMQNYELLRALGKTDKPILLKRAPACTLEELLMSAEHVMAAGNPQVILCERGIRTFERSTRNTLDLSAIPLLKRLTHLPVIVDPSHATGSASLVAPMSLAAAAAGADGLMIEVHDDPQHALCDGPQAITPEEFRLLSEKTRRVREAVR